MIYRYKRKKFYINSEHVVPGPSTGKPSVFIAGRNSVHYITSGLHKTTEYYHLDSLILVSNYEKFFENF